MLQPAVPRPSVVHLRQSTNRKQGHLLSQAESGVMRYVAASTIHWKSKFREHVHQLTLYTEVVEHEDSQDMAAAGLKGHVAAHNVQTHHS